MCDLFLLHQIKPQVRHLRFQRLNRRPFVYLSLHHVLLSNRLLHHGRHFLELWPIRHIRRHLLRASSAYHDLKFPRRHARGLQHVHLVHYLLHYFRDVWSVFLDECPSCRHFWQLQEKGAMDKYESRKGANGIHREILCKIWWRWQRLADNLRGQKILSVCARLQLQELR